MAALNGATSTRTGLDRLPDPDLLDTTEAALDHIHPDQDLPQGDEVDAEIVPDAMARGEEAQATVATAAMMIEAGVEAAHMEAEDGGNWNCHVYDSDGVLDFFFDAGDNGK